MLTRGIAAKLYIAFGGSFLLALLAATVGWQGFERIADSQNSVIDEAIPGLRENHALAELNTSIGQAARELAQVDTETERVRASAALFGQVAALNALLDRFREQGFANEMLPSLLETVEDLTRRLRDQDELVKQRGRQLARFNAVASRIVGATSVLNDVANSLVANSAATTTAITSSLYDMVERNASRDQLFAVFDRLVEEDIDALERMYELRLRSANLRALLDQIGDVSSIETLTELRTDALRNLTIIKRRVAEINDPERRRQATATVRTMDIDSGPLSVAGIFQTRRSLIDIDRQLLRVQADVAEASVRLSGIVNSLNTAAGLLLNRVSTLAKSELERSRSLFRWAAFISLLVAGLVLWGYVNRNVIRRLVLLESATRSMANGNYDVDPPEDGDDELSSMGRGLRVFRNNALEKRRLDEELLQYKRGLEHLVQVRTQELEVANTRLAEEAQQHDVARDKAEQANRAKTAFLATMSHELRTPLSGALGTLRLLSETTLEKQQQALVDTIEGANATLLDILNDILGYSQIEAGKLRIENRPFNLHDLLADVARLMSAPARENGNALSLQIDPSTPAVLVADSGKLRQVLLNLLGNANKFTDNGHITLEVKSVATAEPADARVAFTVSDTGIGIQADEQDEVFQAFTQVDSSIARNYGGIGLGLAICDRLVQVLGGAISLQSTPGAGTRVNFEIVARVGVMQDLPPATSEHLTWPVAQPLQVLVVEDDPVNRAVVAGYLARMGHGVVQAEHGEQALALLDEQPITLVLLDISLPGMDGMAVLERIRDGGRSSLPVIAMSAHVFDEEVSEFLQSGMDGYLGKPFSIADLHHAIEAMGGGVKTLLPAAETGDELMDATVVDADLAALGVEAVHAMVALFDDVSGGRFAELDTALANDDLAAVANIAHQMRGTAANFGLDRLCGVLAKVEQDAIDDARPALSRHELETLHTRSMTALRAHLAQASHAAEQAAVPAGPAEPVT